MQSSLVLTDRTTATKYAITISDNQLLFTSTASTADPEPVIIDSADSSKWKLFIDDGQLGIESTGSSFTDYIQLYDSVLATNNRLIVDNGSFGFINSAIPTPNCLTVTVSNPSVTVSISGGAVNSTFSASVLALALSLQTSIRESKKLITAQSVATSIQSVLKESRAAVSPINAVFGVVSPGLSGTLSPTFYADPLNMTIAIQTGSAGQVFRQPRFRTNKHNVNRVHTFVGIR